MFTLIKWPAAWGRCSIPFAVQANCETECSEMKNFLKLIEAMTMFMFVLAVFLAIVGVFYRG